ncbi:MAG: hypothetical protein HZC36_01035 [Armatimonadetes bacterium]|nr:hypothetical protein [Armatimonadota bacterium]
MHLPTRTCIALALAALSLGALATQGKRLLSVTCRKGDTFRYELTSRIEAGDGSGAIDLALATSEKLIKVKGESLEWEVDYTKVAASASGSMQGADSQFQGLQGIKLVLIQNRQGQVLKIRMSGMEIAAKGSAHVVLPKSAVQIGDSWGGVLEISGQPIPIRYQLAGFETYKGKEAARIDGTYPKDSIAKAIKPTRFLVEVKTGKVLYGSAETLVQVGEQQVKVSYTLTRK